MVSRLVADCVWAHEQNSCFHFKHKKSLFLLAGGSVYFVQFPPHLIAGVAHSDECAQYPKPPCVVQVFRMFPTILLAQPPKTHSLGPPPCFAQRPLRIALVVHPATEHGFFFPPQCLKRCDPAKVCVAGAPFKLARSICTMISADATCLRKSGATFLPVHTFLLLPPPCLWHRPLALAPVVQLLNEQIP